MFSLTFRSLSIMLFFGRGREIWGGGKGACSPPHYLSFGTGLYSGYISVSALVCFSDFFWNVQTAKLNTRRIQFLFVLISEFVQMVADPKQQKKVV